MVTNEQRLNGMGQNYWTPTQKAYSVVHILLNQHVVKMMVLHLNSIELDGFLERAPKN